VWGTGVASLSGKVSDNRSLTWLLSVLAAVRLERVYPYKRCVHDVDPMEGAIADFLLTPTAYVDLSTIALWITPQPLTEPMTLVAFPPAVNPRATFRFQVYVHFI
jgi:hypothetical protein